MAAAVDARRAAWDERTEVAKAKGRAPQNAGGTYFLSGGMLVCGTCGGHFEAYRASWKPEPVYVCATRRRKPGVCTNKAAIPIFDADNIMLDMVEDEVLSPAYVDTLLAMKARVNDPAETPRLERCQRERLQCQMKQLVDSIAHGVAPEDVAPQIAERRAGIEAVTKRLASVQDQPDLDHLRDALLQRCEEWRQVLRGEVQVARIVLRKHVGPIFLEDPLSPEQALAVGVVPASDSPYEEDIIRWEAPIKPGILEGFATVHEVASLICVSWNQLGQWLRTLDGLRRAA